MDERARWLKEFADGCGAAAVDGLVNVRGYVKTGRPPEEVAVMEKAAHYDADAVFFEASRNGKPPEAQAFVYRSDDPPDDPGFAQLHQRLWSWGGVPLVFRATRGLIQLFRCGHQADFEAPDGKVVVNPYKTLETAVGIAADPWWDAERLRNGTLWDDPAVCRELLSSDKAAQETLIRAVKELSVALNKEGILSKHLHRKLLMLSLLIRYLEERRVFEDGYFGRFGSGGEQFFELLGDARALASLLDELKQRFNGHVFVLSDEDREALRTNQDELARFARFVEARQEVGGQRTLWERYSFADLPVELISHIYQLFVEDTATAVYTPLFLVRLMLDEALSWECLRRLEKDEEIILDPACGSGVFLVEAYKRLVLHWRSQHNWQRPDQTVLKRLLKRVHGVDKEEGAVELAAFSLCLALCDALEPEEIRASVKLFPELKEISLHYGCFFEACEQGKMKGRIGAVVGNPPFASSMGTPAAERAHARYQAEFKAQIPDRQRAYLFLHEAMRLLAPGGILCMLQPCGLLYNQQPQEFRRRFIEQWDLREILDFVSVRGLFTGADPKVIAVVAEANSPAPGRQILHATVRRTSRTEAAQGFDIDYYDLHWLPREVALTNDAVWRADLLGGGRVLSFVERLRKLRTLGEFADEQEWECGEGFIVGKSGSLRHAAHLTDKPYLPSEAVLPTGIDQEKITNVTDRLFKTAYTPERFTPPMLVIREHMDLDCGVWLDGDCLTYKNKVVGICGTGERARSSLLELESFLRREREPLRAFVAATSIRMFTQLATTLAEADVLSLPYPADHSLGLSEHEGIIVSDIVEFYREFIRLGEKSAVMREPGVDALPDFNRIYAGRINAVYGEGVLVPREAHRWPGILCQPFAFGEREVDWTGVDELKGRLDRLLSEQCGTNLNITRIARIYDGPFVFLLKPDRLRFWLRSVALRDADETLADLWAQGF